VASNLPIDGHSFRRVEVLTSIPRRLRWSLAEKAAIVAESQAPGAQVSEIALRYGLHRNQLHVWRREFGAAADANAREVGRADPTSFRWWRIRRSTSRSAARACVSARGASGLTRQGAAAVESDQMILALLGTPSTGVRVRIATRPVDFRRGADGLAATVQSVLRQDPFGGTIFVFRSKRARPVWRPVARGPRHSPRYRCPRAWRIFACAAPGWDPMIASFH
jgi:transposase-like protein